MHRSQLLTNTESDMNLEVLGLESIILDEGLTYSCIDSILKRTTLPWQFIVQIQNANSLYLQSLVVRLSHIGSMINIS